MPREPSGDETVNSQIPAAESDEFKDVPRRQRAMIEIEWAIPAPSGKIRVIPGDGGDSKRQDDDPPVR